MLLIIHKSSLNRFCQRNRKCDTHLVLKITIFSMGYQSSHYRVQGHDILVCCASGLRVKTSTFLRGYEGSASKVCVANTTSYASGDCPAVKVFFLFTVAQSRQSGFHFPLKSLFSPGFGVRQTKIIFGV